VVLAVGSGDASGVFSGGMTDGAGSVALVKFGTGTQTLHGACAINGPTSISNGALLVNGALSGTGMVTISGGTLGGSGVVAGLVVQLGGVVAPGSSPGTLTFLSDYAQAGDLAIDIAGTSPGSGHDRLVVGGSATLFATLTVTTNGYAPVAGDRFTILTASNGVNGTFALVSLPPLGAGDGWDVIYTNTAVILSVTGVPPPAAGYDLYATQIPNPADRGYRNDPDADGYANLLEYVTGGSPTNTDTAARMNAARTNGLLALRFTRATNSTDATLIVEGSFAATNNAKWTGIATNLAGSWGGAPNVAESGAGSPVNVTVTDTAAPATNRFLRLRVTRP
jgi:autotransporter-associated beta strand protein